MLMAIPWKPGAGIRRDYTCGTCNGEEIVQTTNFKLKAVKTVDGKLSRGLEVRVLSGAPISKQKVKS